MSNNQHNPQYIKQDTSAAPWPNPDGSQGQQYSFPNSQAEQSYNASVQAYYQQYYNNYYAGSSGQNYSYPNSQQYQQNTQGNYNYQSAATNSASTTAAGSGSNQIPAQDYNAWYQQQGYTYPYSGSTYQNYGQYPNSYSNGYAAAPAQIPQNGNTAAKAPEKPAISSNFISSNGNQNHVNSAPMPPNLPPPPPPLPKALLPVPPQKVTGTNSFPVGKRERKAFGPTLQGVRPEDTSTQGKDLPVSAPNNYSSNSTPSHFTKKTFKPRFTPVDTSKPIFGNTSLDTNTHRSSAQTVHQGSNPLSVGTKISADPGPVPEKTTVHSKYPVGLQNYISNLYAKFPEAKNNDKIQKALVDMVVKASSENRLWTTDWESQPLPSDLIVPEPTVTASSTHKKRKQPVTSKKSRIIKDTAPRSSSSSSDSGHSNIHRRKEIRRQKDRDDKLRNATRRDRFASIAKAPVALSQAPVLDYNREDVIDWDDATVIGTCLELEKSYFRLTSAPDPARVRPLSVLKEWFEILLVRWENTKDYAYILDQFQAIRQDLTVQRIKNTFTVQVYESVARITMTKGDLGEFNKCQAQLKTLYSYGIPGSLNEFIAYRILYYLYTRSQSDINTTIKQLTSDQKDDDAIQHALQLRAALSTSNYVRFFLLYRTTPNLGRHLIDNFLLRERLRFLVIICTSFRQTIPISYVESKLGFTQTEECVEFLKSAGIIFESEPVGASSLDKDGKPVLFVTRSALLKVQENFSKTNKVDIKGQLN